MQVTQPVVEIGAKATTGDPSAQILVRRRDDTHVDAARLRAADGNDFSFTQHPQQHRLHLQ